MFARETARLQPLSLQSRHRKGRAQVSPSQVPESVPAPLLFLLPFSGIHLCLNPGPLVPRKSPLINARVSTSSQMCRDVGIVCFLLVLPYQSSLAFPGCFTRTAKC